MSGIINTTNAVGDGMLIRRYGAGTCPLCNNVHDGTTTLVESGGSKAYVELLLANMAGAMSGFSATKQKQAKCMIGALVPNGRGQVLIAASGSGDRPVFQAAAQLMPGAFVCGPLPGTVTTRGGRTITAGELAGMRVDNEPLQCAAPKLIWEARQRNYTLPWDMTEIWFDPLTFETHFAEIGKAAPAQPGGRTWQQKSKQAGYTKHGWSIASCATCTNVVPALMCTLAA